MSLATAMEVLATQVDAVGLDLLDDRRRLRLRRGVGVDDLAVELPARFGQRLTGGEDARPDARHAGVDAELVRGRDATRSC